jgi:hypothetical protein
MARDPDSRRSWPLVRRSLRDRAEDDLSASTTPEERLSMMWPLALSAWTLTGAPLPDYRRSEAPGRIVRGLPR